MSGRTPFVWLVAAALAGIAGWALAASPSPPPQPLKAPADFRGISDRTARSAALFIEAGRVLQHPRCLNCHPQGRSPTQGENLSPHTPFIHAGEEGHGAKALPCATCHQVANVRTHGATIETIPGHEHWSLAPPSMAWQGLSLSQICAQIKDPARNGGRTMAQIHEHLARDSLVGWAWRPGLARNPAPGTQERFGQLVAAWIETGAACPRS